MYENDVFKLSRKSRLALYRRVALETFLCRIVASGFHACSIYPPEDEVYYRELKEKDFLVGYLGGYSINIEKLSNYINIDNLSRLRISCYYEKENSIVLNNDDRANLITCDFNYPSTPEVMFGLDILAASMFGLVNLDKLAETLGVSSDVLNTAKEQFYGLTKADNESYYVNVPALCRQLHGFKQICFNDLDTSLILKDTTDLFSDLSDE